MHHTRNLQELVQNVDSIVTKGGDAGTTGLLYGGRVPKDDLHTEAYGALDEAISALGLARSLAKDRATQVLIEELERELFTAGAELATLPSAYDTYKKHFPPIVARTILRGSQWTFIVCTDGTVAGSSKEALLVAKSVSELLEDVEHITKVAVPADVIKALRPPVAPGLGE